MQRNYQISSTDFNNETYIHSRAPDRDVRRQWEDRGHRRDIDQAVASVVANAAIGADRHHQRISQHTAAQIGTRSSKLIYSHAIACIDEECVYEEKKERKVFSNQSLRINRLQGHLQLMVS